MKALTKHEYPRFFRTILGLFLEPAATTEALFMKSPPPYVVRFLAFFMFTTFLPFFVDASSGGFSVAEGRGFVALIGIVILTIVFFVAVEGILLLLMGLEASPLTVLAMVTYSLAPLAVATWLFYFFTYVSEGEFRLADTLLTGRYTPSDFYMRALPYVIAFTQIVMMVVFYFALVAGLRLGYLSAGAIAIVSLIPLALSFSLAIYAANQYAPGTADLFLGIIKLPMMIDLERGTG